MFKIKSHDADQSVEARDIDVVKQVAEFIYQQYDLPEIEINLAGAASVGDGERCGFGVYFDSTIWLAAGRDEYLVQQLQDGGTSFELFLATNTSHELRHAIQHLILGLEMADGDERLEGDAIDFSEMIAKALDYA